MTVADLHHQVGMPTQPDSEQPERAWRRLDFRIALHLAGPDATAHLSDGRDLAIAGLLLQFTILTGETVPYRKIRELDLHRDPPC